MACIVVAYIVLASIVVACMVMTHKVVACTAMAYVVMACIVVACMVMTHKVMAMVFIEDRYRPKGACAYRHVCTDLCLDMRTGTCTGVRVKDNLVGTRLDPGHGCQRPEQRESTSYSYDLCSYGLDSCGLYSQDLCSSGLYNIVMAKGRKPPRPDFYVQALHIVLAYAVMA